MGTYSVSDALKLAFYAAATVYVSRKAWKALPAWMKPKQKDAGEESDANDDLASPTVILRKVQAMMQLCSDEVKHDLPWYKMHACFLAFLHLQRELEVAYPEHKNDRYRKEGDALSDKSEIHELMEYCQLAKWAYLDCYLELHAALKKAGYALLRHDVATEPGRVGHFIAVNHQDKLAIISIKGTSTFSDALTDILGQALDHTLQEPLKTEATVITDVRVHEGMYAAANMLCEDTKHLVENFFLPQSYKIVVTGHSLGAGVACLLGLFLHSRVAAVSKENLRVLAFATPPCLDLATCQAMAPFTTSIVNNTDCVPRMSVSNLVTLNNLFVKVNDKLTERGLSPNDWKTAKAFLQDIMKVDKDTLMTSEEILEFETQAQQEGRNDHALFVPGKTIVLWESDGKVHSGVGDGGLTVLRHLEIATTMISDHACLKYLENLGFLLSADE